MLLLEAVYINVSREQIGKVVNFDANGNKNIMIMSLVSPADTRLLHIMK
jgi:hypothetical protein